MMEEDGVVQGEMPSLATLKPLHKGLSKSWKVKKKHTGFYAGGKVEVDRSGKFFVCLYEEDVVFVDVKSGEAVKRLQEKVTNKESITAFALRYSTQLITASRNQLIRVWDCETLTCLKTMKAQEGYILAMDVDPSGTLVATGSSDRSVRVFDIDRGFVTHSFKGHEGIVTVLKFNPRENTLQLASGGEDSSLRVWDLVTSSCSAVFKHHLSALTAASFSPDGWTLVSGGRDKVVNLYDLRSFKLLITVPVYEVLEGLCVLAKGMEPSELADPGLLFVTAGDRGQLRMWNVTRKPPGSSPPVSCKNIMTEKRSLNAFHYTGLSLSHRRKLLVVSTHDQNLLMYTPDLERTKLLVGYNDEVIEVRYIPQPADREGQSAQSNLSSNETSDSSSSNPSRVAVATNSEKVRVLDLERFSWQILAGHHDIVLGLDVSPDGRWLVSVSKDKTARLWDLGTNSCLGTFIGHTEAVGAVSFSKKVGNFKSGVGFAVTGSQDKTLKFWSLRALKDIYNGRAKRKQKEPVAPEGEVEGKEEEALRFSSKVTQRAHDKDINSVTVSPNDRFIATGSQDKTIKIWRSEDLGLVAACRGHKRGVWCVEFSPVDQVLASSSGDRTIRIWSMKDYSCLKTFEGHTASVLKVQFITAGMQLVSSGADGLVKLWTIRNNVCENTFDAHDDKIWALAVSPDGREVVTGGADSAICVWEDNTVEQAEQLMEENEQKILKEQDLYNLMGKKDYPRALSLALELNRPQRVLSILSELIDHPRTALRESNMSLDKYVLEAPLDDIRKLLMLCRDWNTNANRSSVSQQVVKSILQCHGPAELKKVEGIGELLDGLISYSERHFQRLDRLVQQSFLLDFTLTSMQQLVPGTAIGQVKQDEGFDDQKEPESVGQQALEDKTDTEAGDQSPFGTGKEVEEKRGQKPKRKKRKTKT